MHDCAIFLERHMIHKNVEEVDVIEGRDEVSFPFTNNSQWGHWKKGKECRIVLKSFHHEGVILLQKII